MNFSKFLQAFGLIALLGFTAFVTQSLTVDKMEKEEQVNSSEPFLGEVIMFAGNFAPRGWAFCEGQLLPISQHSALFSILGTMYGGDGRTTFALPDLRGRTPVGVGNGPGLSPVQQGQKGGSENTTITVMNMPSHNHGLSQLNVEKKKLSIPSKGEESERSSRLSATSSSKYDFLLYSTTNRNANLGQTTSTGASRPINTRQPFTGMRYIIALQGTFPSRN